MKGGCVEKGDGRIGNEGGGDDVVRPSRILWGVQFLRASRAS